MRGLGETYRDDKLSVEEGDNRYLSEVEETSTTKETRAEGEERELRRGK